MSLQIPASLLLSAPLQISFASNLSGLDPHLDAKQKKQFQSLFEQAQSDPAKALSELTCFAKQHPHVPMTSNLISFCHLQLKDLASAEKVIEEAYERFPDYFFAKINYADLLLRRKQWKQVPEVFNGNLDLSSKQRTFHFSEVRGFMTTMGHYYNSAGMRKHALEAFRIAVQADPTHPSIFTLEKALFYNPLLRWIKIMLARICTFA